MTFSLAEISGAGWLATPSAVRALILAQPEELQVQQEELQQLRAQISAMATELANLQKRIGHTSRNPCKSPSSNAPGLRLPHGCRPTGCKRGGQSDLLALGLSRCRWNACGM